MMLRFCVFALLSFACLQAGAGNVFDKAREIGSSAGEIVDRTVQGTVNVVEKVSTGKKEDAVAARAEIDRMALDGVDELFARDPDALDIFNRSYGYAVFDSRVSSIGITAGFGRGVAIQRETDIRTYMKMATGGVNLGAGIQFYRLIFLFPSEKTFRNFVDKGWQAGADAMGAAGKDGASLGVVLANGVSVYQITETGIMLKASLTGSKFWQSDELNAVD